MILPIFMFSRSGNSIITLQEFYHHRLTLKIQYKPEVLELRGYPSFSLVEFYDITYIYVFEVGEFNGDTFRILLPPIDLENPIQTGSTRTSRLPIFFLWWNFMILPKFMFSRSGNSMVTLSEFHHHRLTSKIQFEPEVLRTSRLPIFFSGGIL